MNDKKECTNQKDSWLTKKAGEKERQRGKYFSGHLNTVPVRVNLTQHIGPFDKGLPNTERFVGVIANGLKVFRSVKKFSYCKLVNWLTKKRQRTDKYIQILNWHSDFTHRPCKFI